MFLFFSPTVYVRTLVVEQEEKESKGPARSSQLLEISSLHPIRPNKSRAFTTAPLPARHCRRRRWRGGATIVRGAIQVGTRAAAVAEYSKERLCDVFPKKLGKPTGIVNRGVCKVVPSRHHHHLCENQPCMLTLLSTILFFQTAIPTTTTTTAERHDLTRVTLL